MGDSDKEFEIQFFESLLKKSPGYPEAIEILGGLYTQKGLIDEGLKMDKKLIKLKPNSPDAHYNLACSFALKNKKEEAVAALQKAIDLGYKDYKWLIGDPDLKPLQDYPPFKELLQKIRKSI